jgi:DNA repair protein SbcD/Mre11
MAIKIFHTADLHLGMKFARGYAPDVQDSLKKVRFETLQKLIQLANQHSCDLFVIAGDLFHNPRVPKKEILEVAGFLKQFQGQIVIILPGNHDYYQLGEDTLWSRFKENQGEQTLILSEARPYDLRQAFDLNIMLYPGPCTASHSKKSALDWIATEPRDADNTFHVGLAHGSLESLSPDFNQDYYPMTKGEINQLKLDLWLLGHTHVRFPDEEQGTEARIFIPATPEPDGFDCHHSGYAWIIELLGEDQIRYLSIQTGKNKFHHIDFTLKNEIDLNELKTQFSRLNREQDLVKLKLKGRVKGEIFEERGALIDYLKQRVLHLETDSAELLREITMQDIDNEFTADSFPHTLLRSLAQNQQNPYSLQKAYELIQEARS